jgi:hypothetical protein
MVSPLMSGMACRGPRRVAAPIIKEPSALAMTPASAALTGFESFCEKVRFAMDSSVEQEVFELAVLLVPEQAQPCTDA